jgi:hypothetical protein
MGLHFDLSFGEIFLQVLTSAGVDKEQAGRYWRSSACKGRPESRNFMHTSSPQVGENARFPKPER